MNSADKLITLESSLRELYKRHQKELLFHGWHHITFVRIKAKFFAENIGADAFIVESAALVHDLNYIVRSNSEPSEGKVLREGVLNSAQYTPEEIVQIEKIIIESHTATRSEQISEEGKALSDGDTLFKALPITAVYFTGKYLTENKVNIMELADKIINEQVPLVEKGIYFYTDFAKQNYMKWVKTNIELWKNIRECLRDKDIEDLIKNSL